MAWTEVDTSNHCKLFMVLLHDGVFNKYVDDLHNAYVLLEK